MDYLDTYKCLARVLDTLPNGFPPTDTGIELRILEKIFSPEEAALFCDLRLVPETAGQIASRTGRPSAGLEEKLVSMWHRGELWGCDAGGEKTFKMIPWVVGIYEFQIDRMDRELADMCRQYAKTLGPSLFLTKPQLMQVVPVEKPLQGDQRALSHGQVSEIIEASRSLAVNECICNKQNRLLGKGCDKPREICLGLSTEAGFFDRHPWGRPISRQEAMAVLQTAEDRGYVHLSSNVRSAHQFICNCCSCCCPVLKTVRGLRSSQYVHTETVAAIDEASCSACGLCAQDRCPMSAIKETAPAYRVREQRCIGCGLCVSICPEGAISLVPKPGGRSEVPPKDEMEWMEARARERGVDFSQYK